MPSHRNASLKVLVVEDSKVVLKGLCNYLERMGIANPLTAETGLAALEVYERERPDIILLDALLPDIDGFEIAKRIRAKEHPEEWTAIIFLTSMSKDEDLVHGITAGGDDYLMKPISQVVLQAKISAMRRLVEMQRKLVDTTHQLNAANKELQRLSTTDGLTGIANRRMFDELLMREWRRCQRAKKPLALVMVDVDFFKQYNDTYGHQAGDACLQAVAKQMARSAPRASDVAARYGGEEFALILGDTEIDGAVWVANYIRQNIADLKMAHKRSPFNHVTVSCGVAAIVPSDKATPNELILSADHALYLAKEQGRDRVAGMGN
ncbi:Phytochrome-like protein cph2 [Ferriphaselus amnicola]|uniref:diguanylate cyclase n=1 Tax=Ferriphaselus amnicola TaxID=1188319 RepID=A0A2Z6GA53_9PROT|nr:diguanylate cyclase [Ferriphaselus amnicola]BBE50333.1 Phytochrome-like protein cph2 [Ferriphaselus amnicola]